MSARQTIASHQADIDKIATMAHPARRKILDLLSAYGPATVGTLARDSGQRVGSISHHLKMLARAGLIEEAPELARDRRESWWRVVRASWTWSAADFDDDPAGRVVAEAAERDQLRGSVEHVRAWFDQRDDYDQAWRRAAFTSTSRLNLTVEELDDLGRQMSDLMGEFAESVDTSDGKDRQSVFAFTYAIPTAP
ncbi:MAG TPA: helix-turn-helix domain-containing protein [Nocardioidaceae bacterium]|nr:helix-turn-helix domain-containing protein [Nocardioidaceae bacterium]